MRIMLIIALMLAAHQAGAEQILVGLDNKAFFEAAGVRFGPPGTDEVMVVDITDPAHPALGGRLVLNNSVLGPPTNLQITPDGKRGLIASSAVNAPKGDGWGMTPDDKLYVLDLTGAAPRVIETLTLGRMPSGLSINRAGTLALVANRAGKSISVVALDATPRLLAEVPVEDEAAAVVITPDGKRAFFAKNLAHKVGVLRIDGTSVSYDKKWDMPVGYGVYNIDVTADGSQVIASNTGIGGDGNVDTVSVIDARATPPRVVDHVTVGDGPEGFAITPDGRHAIAVLLRGTAALQSAWSYTKTGAVTLLSQTDGHWRVTGQAEAGDLPEGVAFSADSQFAYVGNYKDRNIQVYRIEGDTITDTGVKLALPGQPASLRETRR